MTPCPCGAAGPPKRAGHAPTRYRDLGPLGKAIEVAGTRQRFSCRGCGATTSRDPVELLPGFRMTLRLSEAAFARALAVGFLGCAEELDLDERTVRAVFARLSERTLARADAAMPDTLLARVADVGRHRLALAHDPTTGELANLYADAFDPRLLASLSALRRRRLHIDNRMAAVARNALHASCSLTIHRAGAEDELVGRLPACVRLLRRSLAAADRRILFPVRRILAKRPSAMSWEESRRLREACGASEPLREFAERRDALVAIWGTPRLAEAEAAVAAWRRSLGTLMRRAFAPALSWLDEWGPHVLNKGYGKVPLQAWRRACAVRPAVLPHDSAARLVVRTLRTVLEHGGPRPVWDLRPAAVPRP